MSFAEQIRETRKGLGLTQAELARLLETGKRTVEKWESGEAVPHPLTQEGAIGRMKAAGKRARVAR